MLLISPLSVNIIKICCNHFEALQVTAVSSLPPSSRFKIQQSICTKQFVPHVDSTGDIHWYSHRDGSPSGLPIVLKIAYSDTWLQSHMFVTGNCLPITRPINVPSENNRAALLYTLEYISLHRSKADTPVRRPTVLGT
jgi:hypothetical protein